MSEPGIARFPSPDGRIPNFVGAEQAAERLRAAPLWQRARTVKSNPDSPQLPVRQRALEDGKLLYMAVPRLADEQPFFLLDPTQLVAPPRQAVSIKGAARSARTVGIDELEAVDLVVTGCVAVGEDGARLGKGGGFSDLEYALAAEAGLIGPGTMVVTTVHDAQLVAAGEVPTTAHDMHVDLIATPTQILECARRRGRRPVRVRWEELTEEKIRAIPFLARLQDR
jgi:5-formyltetrahydrofolate cyclo-ligase